MVFPPLQFLAAGQEDDWTKVVIGAIAVAIWLIGSLAQATNKKKEKPAGPPPDYRSPEEIARAQQQEIVRKLREISGQPVKAPPLPQQTARSQPKPPAVKRKAVRKVPPPPAPPRATPPQPAAPKRAESETQPPRPQPVMVNAATLNRWLRPATLKQQYIVTEILQKPVALRPDHLDDV